MSNISEVIKELKEKLKEDASIILEPNTVAYEEKRQIANPYYQLRPAVIIMCKHDKHVEIVMKVVNEKNYNGPLRVRSGGHDHEGECSGNNALVIDLSDMNEIKVEKGYVSVQPGASFEKLVTVLNNNNVGLQHGTCKTVRIAGYTFGGGWGPWTRAKGMICESLAAVGMVSGMGNPIEIIDPSFFPAENEFDRLTFLNKQGKEPRELDDRGREILWSLRGGGGMSFGIVTVMIFKTFPLPNHTAKVTAKWVDNAANILNILLRWEEIIAPNANEDLLGTNLKMLAIPKSKETDQQFFQCEFYGYFQDVPIKDVKEFMENKIKQELFPVDVYGNYFGFNVEDGSPKLMAYWDTFKKWDTIGELNKRVNLKDGLGETNEPQFLHYKNIPVDKSDPAPHKITSKLAIKGGLGREGGTVFLDSLASDLLFEDSAKAGIKRYATLGAISGMFYKDYPKKDRDSLIGSAFPYKDCSYTVQYQLWWNEEKINPNADQYLNAAFDWIDACRHRDIPNTKGSFISFKDASIPRKEYFGDSYNRLKDAKEKYCEDPLNRLSTRKTVI